MSWNNLPHGFTTTEMTKQIIIQFREDPLNNSIMNYTDLHELNTLLRHRKIGLQFTGNTKKNPQEIISEITEIEGLNKLIKLLNLLSLLFNTNEYNTICSKEYSNTLNLNPSIQISRMKITFDYIEQNFKKDITISDAANKINLINSAFYEFIKKHTNKIFTQILSEYRSNHASKQLTNSGMTVAAICFDSGFKNLSYLNQRFKEIFKESPNEFREKIS